MDRPWTTEVQWQAPTDAVPEIARDRLECIEPAAEALFGGDTEVN